MALNCKRLCPLNWNLHNGCRWCFCRLIANRRRGGCSLGLPHTSPGIPDSSPRGNSTRSFFRFSPRPSYRNRFDHRFQIQPQIGMQAHQGAKSCSSPSSGTRFPLDACKDPAPRSHGEGSHREGSVLVWSGCGPFLAPQNWCRQTEQQCLVGTLAAPWPAIGR